jgi:gas vesicle protein
VDDRTRVALAALLGAVAGAAFGYLYLTDGGCRLRAELEPGLDQVSDELRRIRRTVEKARQAAIEGLQTLDDLSGSAERTWTDAGLRASR